MKQKFNELLDKPWTTRGYLKLAGITCVIYTIPVNFKYPLVVQGLSSNSLNFRFIVNSS